MAYDYDKATLLRERDLLLWLHAEAVWNWGQEDASRARWALEHEKRRDELEAVEASRRDWAAEAEYRRREAEFEANGERWENAIVARDGHRRINGFHECECGEPCPSLGMWSDHLAKTRAAEGTSLCACLSAEQAAQLRAVNAAHPDDLQWSLPLCAVHPEADR
jgi:hypothetical protein